MATFVIRAYSKIKGMRAATLEKLLKASKIAKAIEISSVNVEKPARSRSARLDQAMSAFEDAKSIVAELKDEMDNWRSGMEGTNLENSSKFEEVSTAYDELESLESALEDVDFSSIDFPGMY